MDEGDACSPSPEPRLLVDQPGAFGNEVLEGRLDRGDREGDVVQSLAALLEKAAYRSVGPKRHEQLDEGTAHRQHGLLDPLFLHDLPIQRLHPIAVSIAGEGVVEIPHRNGHMIEVEELHGDKVTLLGSIGATRSRVSNSVITAIARTPIGKFGGALAPMRAVELGGVAVAAALERSALEPAAIDEVIFGHVLQAGEGQITARQAAVNGGLPMTVPSVTINKVCLSGMSAIGLADRAVRLGEAKFVMAGGMESMSNAPYVSRDLRWGARIGDTEMIDVLQHDGLFCAFDHCTMGESSDRKNERLGIGRDEQDDWAAGSHRLAAEATSNGRLGGEITPVEVPQRRGDPILVDTDEGIRAETTAETLARLEPAFVESGTITAGNASQVSDGAAAVVVASRKAAEASGTPVLAEILAYGQVGGVDATLHERPAEALAVALKKAGLEPSDLDLVEINEAFASVSLWAARTMELPKERVNVHGGAVALGHPLGASGARLVVTLINALRHRGGGIGAATLCGGGGQGDAIVLRVEG